MDRKLKRLYNHERKFYKTHAVAHFNKIDQSIADFNSHVCSVKAIRQYKKQGLNKKVYGQLSF